MTARSTLDSLNEAGISVSVQGEHLCLSGVSAPPLSLLEEVAANKAAILALLGSGGTEVCFDYLPHRARFTIIQSPAELVEWAETADHPHAALLRYHNEIVLALDLSEWFLRGATSVIRRVQSQRLAA